MRPESVREFGERTGSKVALDVVEWSLPDAKRACRRSLTAMRLGNRLARKANVDGVTVESYASTPWDSLDGMVRLWLRSWYRLWLGRRLVS